MKRVFTFVSVRIGADLGCRSKQQHADPMKKLSHLLVATLTVTLATVAICLELNPLMICGLYSIAFGAIVTK